MLTQIEISREIQFMFYLIPVVIGIQLSVYFFYQYHKIKDVSLPLNRVLLAFGSFILFIILGPLFIQISRNFILEGFLYEIFSRIGWILVLFSTISVSLFIIRNDFVNIINLNIAKILLILNFIPIVAVLLVETLTNPIFLISISFVVLNGLYIIRFQLILIKKSVGKIRKKFVLFFIGSIISLFALFFAALVGLNLLPPMMKKVIYFTGVSELLLGFIIMVFSVYNFPPFYEFEWRDNLIKLIIINDQTMNYLYSYDFVIKNDIDYIKNQSSLNDYDKILSRGILGFNSIIKTFTRKANERINKIRQDNIHIFLEYGSNNNHLIYTLIVKKDLISTYHLLKSIKTMFESFFKEILLNLDNLKGDNKKVFRSFDKFIHDFLKK
jgi:hypothetical protein